MKNELLYKQIAFGMAVATMLAGTIVFAIAVFSGDIDFSSWRLPGNVFDCPKTAGAILGVLAFIIGLPLGIKFMFEDNTKFYDVNVRTGEARENVGDGCMYQIMGLIMTPLLVFVVLYYITWFIILVVAAVLPYIILAVLAIGASFLGWIGWAQMGDAKMSRFIVAALAVTLLYGLVTWFTAFNVLGVA